MLRDEWLAWRRSAARTLLRRWMPTMVFVVLRRGQAGERDREDRQADRPNRKPAPLSVQTARLSESQDLRTLSNRSGWRNRPRLLSGRPRPI
jgi:hypothetical protein